MLNRKKTSIILMLYLIAWCISPPLAYGNQYRILVIICILMLVLRSWHYCLPMVKQRTMLTVLLIGYLILVGVLSGDSFTLRMNTYILLAVAIASDCWMCNRRIDIKTLQIILLASFLLYTLWNLTTLRAVAVSPRVMRELVRNSSYSEALAKMGVGGYGYLYSAVLALPIGLTCLRDRNITKSIRIIATVFVVTTLLLSVQSQYLMALLLALLAIPLSLSKNSIKSNSQKTMFVIFGAIIFLLMLNIEAILSLLINNIEIDSIQRKLADLYAIIVEGEAIADSEFAARAERYSRDLNLILTRPLFGHLTFNAVGKHSNILDMFAQYGIPLGIAYLNLITVSCRKWIKKGMNVAASLLCIFLIFACLNTVTGAAAVPLFVMLPVYCRLQEEYNNG